MYVAEDQAGVFADEGDLWAFRVTAKNGVPVNPAHPFNGANDYGDVQPGDDFAVSSFRSRRTLPGHDR